MAKIELSLNVHYLPEWNAWHGIRELIQNGRDAAIQFDAPLTVDHTASNYLVITNRGTQLPHEVLLLGTTTKADDTTTIGKFGEGLKLGVLALVRAGHSVLIQSGDENWRPFIERSDKFKADVLKFEITKSQRSTSTSEVRIKVGGVTKEIWRELRDRFLFLVDFKPNERVEVSSGQLLLGERFRGKVFVKGIFVQDRASAFGYDFCDATVDRDRKMIGSWDLEYLTSKVWREASVKRPDLMPTFLDLCERNDADVAYLKHTSDIPDEAISSAVEQFQTRHGADAVPVKTLAESADIEHLGKRGVVVSESLSALLTKKLGDIEQVKKDLASEATKFYGWHELADAEKATLTWAVERVAKAAKIDGLLNNVDVVDFRSGTLLGQFKAGRYLLAKKELHSREEVLATLIHEVAHNNGGDGDKGHVAAIEMLWTAVVREILGSGS